jgi:hypothetical protein
VKSSFDADAADDIINAFEGQDRAVHARAREMVHGNHRVAGQAAERLERY